MKVLVIEKEQRAAARIHEALRQIWCDVDVLEDGAWEDDLGEKEIPGERAEFPADYDAVIIGSGLPRMPGGEILGRLRAGKCRLPVLMVTGDSAEERIRGLERGADYCLSEPFQEGELLAALKAILRRNSGFVSERLVFGDITLDHGTFVLSGPGGSFQLGKREFDVMQTLMLNTDLVVSKEFLLSRAWGDHPEAVENNVEVYISLLRKKLRELRSRAAIVTKRNLGYRLMEEERS